MELLEYIRACAIENAVKFNGKASDGAVFGKVLSKFPEQKQQVPQLKKTIAEVLVQVNSTPLETLNSELAKLQASGILEVAKKAEKKELKELDGAKFGNVVMRFAPAASGKFHIGHAITGGLTSLYCKKYGGKFILRVEDTNSDNIDPEAYEWQPKQAAWVFGNVSEVVIQSDRMELYYKWARQLVASSHIYVCTCENEAFKKIIEAQQKCPCRSLSTQEHVSRFEKMFDKKNGYKEGEAVVRFAADVTHPNPAMRDFPLIRINDSAHPRVGTKFRVWPLMNFSVFVDDMEMGMTHNIRAKEHLDNSKRQEMLFAAVGKTPPRSYFTGRYNIEGLEISKTKTKELIAQGVYTGWDDVRLAFLEPLRRRGYQPGCFLRYTQEVGLSPVDKSITADDFFKALDAFNKDIIDPISNRFSMLVEPVAIKLSSNPHTSVELALHPDKKSAGGRPFTVGTSVLIEKADLASLHDGDMLRLMDLCNLIKQGDLFEYHSEDYDTFKNWKQSKKIIHWLPDDASQRIAVSILMPDASVVTGICEKNITVTRVDQTVQFERFGFVRLDSIDADGTYKFWFAHK